jgi:hypothetical protein
LSSVCATLKLTLGGLCQIPKNLTFDEASTIPLGFTTAAIGLYQEKRDRGGAGLVAPWADGGRGKYAGQAIYIPGGSSSVGQYGTFCFSGRQSLMMTRLKKLTSSTPTREAQWLQPHHHHSLHPQRRLLPRRWCHSRHRLPHHAVRIDPGRRQGVGEGAHRNHIRPDFYARLAEGGLGDLGAQREPCPDPPPCN